MNLQSAIFGGYLLLWYVCLMFFLILPLSLYLSSKYSRNKPRKTNSDKMWRIAEFTIIFLVINLLAIFIMGTMSTFTFM